MSQPLGEIWLLNPGLRREAPAGRMARLLWRGCAERPASRPGDDLAPRAIEKELPVGCNEGQLGIPLATIGYTGYIKVKAMLGNSLYFVA